MIVAIMEVHLKNGFFLGYDMQKAGYEYALTLGIAALALIFTGPGTLAVDNLLD
jgi:putative oxidoreductase